MKQKLKSEQYRGFNLWFWKNPITGRAEVWHKNVKLADNKTKKESFKNAKERIDYQLFRVRFSK